MCKGKDIQNIACTTFYFFRNHCQGSEDLIGLNGSDQPHLAPTSIPGTPSKLQPSPSLSAWAVLQVKPSPGWALVVHCSYLVSWLEILNVRCQLSLGLYLALTSGQTLDPCCNLVSSPTYGPVSICSWSDFPVGLWIRCATCLVLGCWRTLLPSLPTHVQALWDWALLVRALLGLGSPLPPRLLLPWGAAVSHCSLMLALQRSLLPWSLIHRFPVPMCLPKHHPSQPWIITPEEHLP